MHGKTIGFDVESRSASTFPAAPPVAPARRRLPRREEGSKLVASLESILRMPDPSTALSAWELDPFRVEFKEFSDEMKSELAPEGRVDSLLVERVIQAAWRLKGAMNAEEIWSVHEASEQNMAVSARLRCQPLNDLRRDTRLAEKALRRSLDNLEHHRSAQKPLWGKSAVPAKALRDRAQSMAQADREIPASITNEWAAPAETAAEPAAPRWQDRLVYDFNVSDSSPVVKGTWVTVSHIVTLVVDGWTWADILRSHPELTEEDIRICLSFATEGDGLEA